MSRQDNAKFAAFLRGEPMKFEPLEKDRAWREKWFAAGFQIYGNRITDPPAPVELWPAPVAGPFDVACPGEYGDFGQRIDGPGVGGTNGQ